MFPEILVPTSNETIETTSGIVVSIPKATPVFSVSKEVTGINTFGGKALLEFEGSPCFAELIILRHFMKSGWSGRWVEPYGAPRMEPRLLTAWHPDGLKAQTNVPIVKTHLPPCSTELPREMEMAILGAVMLLSGTTRKSFLLSRNTKVRTDCAIPNSNGSKPC